MTPSNSSPMPNMTNPLNALEPNILPAPIGAFPPAPGWWVLGFLILTAITALGLWLWLRRRRNAYRRVAIQQLEALCQDFDHHQDMNRFRKQCNHLLKAVALQVWPREAVATLYGQPWLHFLDASLKGRQLFTKGPGQCLGQELYARSNKEQEQTASPDTLHQAIRYWLKHHSAKKVIKEDNHV